VDRVDVGGKDEEPASQVAHSLRVARTARKDTPGLGGLCTGSCDGLDGLQAPGVLEIAVLAHNLDQLGTEKLARGENPDNLACGKQLLDARHPLLPSA